MQNLVDVSDTVREHVGGSKRLRDAESPPSRMRAWVNHVNTPLPHVCYRAEFGCSRSSGKIERMRKNGPLASRLSRSLMIIGTDTDRSAAYDFLLVINSNHGPVSYRFQDKRRFRLKIAIFLTPVNLTPPHRGGSSWNFVSAMGLKTRVKPLPERGKV